MAQGIRFLHNFSVGQDSVDNPGVYVLSATSEAVGDFGKENLVTAPLREIWRSTDAASQSIVIQANNTAENIDTFAILNHNLSDAAVVTLKANTVNNFSSPPFSVTLAWREKHIIYTEDLGDNYEFFKITIVDPANACGFFEIGRIVAGTSVVMLDNEDIIDDFSVDGKDLSYQMSTEGFFRASNEKVKVDRLSVRFDKLATVGDAIDNYTNLTDLVEYVGTTLPFLTILDPDDPSFYVLWGQLEDLPTKNFTLNRYVSMGLTIQEVY